MSNYPTMANRMYTPAHIIKCEKINNKGHIEKTDIEEMDITYIAFSNYQGTEVQTDGVLSIKDTATICMGYRADLTAADKIKILSTGVVYDIINTPENWNMQNVFLLFKVECTKGGV